MWLCCLRDGLSGNLKVLFLDDEVLANSTNKGMFQTSYFSEHAPLDMKIKTFLVKDWNFCFKTAFIQVPPTHLLIRTVRCAEGLLFLFISTSLRNFLENFRQTLRFSLSLCISVSVCLSGVPQVTANMEVDVLSHGPPSTVTAPTAATEEPPATAVSNQQQGICRSLKCLKPKI